MESQQIFLLGISPRSGTNFTFKVLCQHPQIVPTIQPGEDLIIQNSQHLLTFIEKVGGNWKKEWFENDEKEKYLSNFQKKISDSIIEYLQPQNLEKGNYCLTKSPSVVHIKNSQLLFPEAKVIILVRNGKDIIESGVKGFNWTYRESMLRHRNYGNLIIDFIEDNKDNPNIHLLKYEDLVNQGEVTLKKIFGFLKLQDDLYDFNYLKETPVLGSSFIRNNENELTWSPQKSDHHFQPTKRSKNWSFLKRKMYDFYCGHIDNYFKYAKKSDT